MTDTRSIAGVILAGGGGRRMFPASPVGGDKSFAELAGQPMIGHVIGRLAPQVPQVVINANGDSQRFARFGLDVIADAGEVGQGPLSGLLAAMVWAESLSDDITAVVTVSTDTPFLPDDLVVRLSMASRGGIAIASSLGRLHPVIGLWPLSLRKSLEAALTEERRSVEKFARLHEAVAVPFTPVTMAGQDVDPFFNANTPEDLAKAHALLAPTTSTKEQANG
ncbi:MAG: molybdenum cofactor guanylyltransferase MobA [Hyphomicrobiaceae bacterium]|nr:molybdenum cofactor guanylyltransferase MobA [Hyphomicrobiaceae bacterium]